jgi:hypothetical protein
MYFIPQYIQAVTSALMRFLQEQRTLLSDCLGYASGQGFSTRLTHAMAGFEYCPRSLQAWTNRNSSQRGRQDQGPQKPYRCESI